MGTSRDQIDLGDLCYEAAWIAPTPLFVVEDSTVVFANHAAVRALGRGSMWDVVGSRPDDLQHADVHWAANIRRSLVVETGGPLCGLPTKLLRADGSSLPVTISLSLFDDPQRRLFLAQVQLSPEAEDLTPPPPAPFIGAFSRWLGRAIFEELELPVALTEDETILLANRATVERIRVTDRADVEGHSMAEFIHPDALVAARERLSAETHRRVTNRRVPLKLRLPDGEELRIAVSGYAVGPDSRHRFLVATQVERA